MKTYHLDINSPLSSEKYWIYWTDHNDAINYFNTIISTDSYHELRILMDLYGFKVQSIIVRRDNKFPDYPKTHKIVNVFVDLKKDE